MTTTAVIPIKQLANAKQRLSGLLCAEERRDLFTAMVCDVLTAVEACVAVDNILVITDDPAVTELAGSFGAGVCPEPASPGLIEAVTRAGEQLAAQGVDTMMFIPGDVPLVSPEELDVVLEGFGQSDGPEFLIVPATDLGGSNCVLCSPPDCMSFAFGVDSFRKHLGIARDRGLNPVVAKLPFIGLDVDTPDDLKALIAIVEDSGTDASRYHTLRYLAQSGILARLYENNLETLAETGSN